ncbi:hypothetical protein EDC32_1011154 [Laceyella sacchari]|nr:hypothetical protein EDC32_1011154 [Laceyella sacchari]
MAGGAQFILDQVEVVIFVVLILITTKAWMNKEYMTVFTGIFVGGIILIFSSDKELIGKLGAYLLDVFGLIDDIEKREIIEAIDEQVKKASENNQETTWKMIGLAFKSALPQDWKQFNESINSGDFYAAVITSIVTIMAFTFTNISNSKSQRFGAYGSIVEKQIVHYQEIINELKKRKASLPSLNDPEHLSCFVLDLNAYITNHVSEFIISRRVHRALLLLLDGLNIQKKVTIIDIIRRRSILVFWQRIIWKDFTSDQIFDYYLCNVIKKMKKDYYQVLN